MAPVCWLTPQVAATEHAEARSWLWMAVTCASQGLCHWEAGVRSQGDVEPGLQRPARVCRANYPLLIS